MLQKVKEYIVRNQLLTEGSKILVAVSGGADSMVLLFILQKLGYRCSVAHMNFNLRGQASDEDEKFVKSYATKHHLDFYGKSVNTLLYAENHGISMEMAARDLRYSFFEEILKKEKITYVAVGHHKNDLVETMLLNLTRGTGVRGLAGIKAKNGNIIRPLLGITNAEIVAFANKNDLLFRTDSTNDDTKIQRNFFRHTVVPHFESINPSFTSTMYKTAESMQQVQKLIDLHVSSFKQKFVEEMDGKIRINKDGFSDSISKEIVLFELLSPFVFNGDQLQEIRSALEQQTHGKTWFSPSHRLLTSHTHLVIQPLEKIEKPQAVWMDKSTIGIDEPINLKVFPVQPKNEVAFNFSPENAYFDAAKINFPLQLRKWKQGDWFVPFGMKGRKKLSDFFIDNKFSLDKKEETFVLLSGDEIIWIVGYRTDDRYKITEETTRVLQMHFNPKPA